MADANGNGKPFDWRRWLADQGPQTVMLVAFAWWVATYLLLPLRDSQQKMNDSMVRANDKHADAAVKNSEAAVSWAAAKQADAMTNAAISDQMKNTTILLQQIRDDQRNGAWKHSEKGT